MSQQKYVVRILVIDDDPKEAEWISALVNEALPQRMGERRAVGYEFHVTSLAAQPGEGQGEFTDRISSYLKGDEGEHANIHVALIDALFGGRSSAESERFGTDVAELFCRLRPTAVRYLLTSRPPTEKKDPRYHKSFQKADIRARPANLANDILEGVEARLKTPLWNALRDYADMGKIVMHAMALADARAIGSNPLIDDFSDFFGLNVLRAEASLTLEPLDSLLGPTGNILGAQRLFAEAFGAHRAYFCTNGTSTANKIVSETLLGPGDVVFLDRNCHISHHYAYMLGSYRPYFLNPYVDATHGLPLTITPKDLYEQTCAYLSRFGSEGREPVLPKLVVITNCSFDGHLVRPDEIIEAYYDALARHGLKAHFARTAFLFDEAWFGFGRFHPKLIGYTATGADYARVRKRVGCVRVYATTSVHKTMSSMRQASVILELDDEAVENRPRSPELMVKFRQAFNCHTTTSPHTAMLASMDIARRQMAFDGYELLDEAIRCAQEFRRQVEGWSKANPPHPAAKYFAVIPEDRYEKSDRKFPGCGADPTKVTLVTISGISGYELKTMLWNEQRVQVNKFGQNSVLLMFMIGSTNALVANLVTALERLANRLDEEGRQGDLPVAERKLSREPMIQEYVDETGKSCQYLDGFVEDRGIGAREAVFSDSFGRYEYLNPTSPTHLRRLEREGTVVAACFVTPYPPGFPIIVPGEIVTESSLRKIRPYLSGEIHGLVARKVPKGKVMVDIKHLPVRVIKAGSTE